MLNSVPLVIAQHSTQDDTSLLNSIGDKWGFPVVSHSEKPAEGFYLQIQNGVLGLADASEKKVLPVEVDFASPASLYRKQHGGGRKEPIVKAIGLKGNEGWHVVDATPGLGRDAFVLVSVGCKVTMIERSPIVAALLEDGIRRLALSFPELAAKMSLQHGN
ncbi:class I SAM-dependent methyltransferase, partial [Alteromonas mediterranea]